MTKVKEPSVINIFYSGDKDKLSEQLKNFDKDFVYEYLSRAVIVPHAGYVYSGELAYKGIKQLNKNLKNLFIFAPAHRVAFEGIALSTYDEWKTPLGNIKINQEINKELNEKFGAQYFDDGYKDEHSIEIQVPLIQTIFNEVQIIPVLIGNENPNIITKIIEYFWQNQDCGFIISSDLSHFLTDDKAKKLDNKTASMIETGSIDGFSFNQACGAIGIYGLCEFINKMNYSLIRIDMYNSSLATNDKSRVVGYGAWILYEGDKNQFIKKYYSNYILNLVKDVISSKFRGNEVITNHAPIFNESGACFVTLKKQGHLRGCIGSIIAHQPLINDLINHAQDAGFRDPRFNPLKEDELKELEIDVSILTEPKKMNFKDEQDLLNQIVPNKDGIIIKDGQYQAVYLPSVWEEIPDKIMFLKSLKIKAGMHPDHFSNSFEAYRFETEYIN